MNVQVEKSVELENIKITLIEDGIIENYIKPGKTAEAKDAWQAKKINTKFAGKKPYTVMIVSGHLANVSKAAREVVASKEFVRKTLAKAIVVNSLGQRLVANFYLTINRPIIKTKVFSERSEAITWLRSELAANKSDK